MVGDAYDELSPQVGGMSAQQKHEKAAKCGMPFVTFVSMPHPLNMQNPGCVPCIRSIVIGCRLYARMEVIEKACDYATS